MNLAQPRTKEACKGIIFVSTKKTTFIILTAVSGRRWCISRGMRVPARHGSSQSLSRHGMFAEIRQFRTRRCNNPAPESSCGNWYRSPCDPWAVRIEPSSSTAKSAGSRFPKIDTRAYWQYPIRFSMLAWNKQKSKRKHRRSFRGASIWRSSLLQHDCACAPIVVRWPRQPKKLVVTKYVRKCDKQRSSIDKNSNE